MAAVQRRLCHGADSELAEWFRKLSPYSEKSRSILKIERDNYDPVTGKQRQIYCLAVSAKRYALAR